MNKRFSITHGQSQYWLVHIWPKDQIKGLRYGQSWFNNFCEFQEIPNEPFTKLFYENEPAKAKQIIEENTNYE